MKKVILITGCRAGIGLATAVATGKAGHIVYAGLRDISTAEALKNASQGLCIYPLQLDITVAAQRNLVIEHILSQHGRLDVLINNAGIGIGGFLQEIEEDELRKVFEVGVFGTWALTKACLPALQKAPRGIVMMMSSLSGQMAIPGIGSYCSAKFALEGMSETWRHELKSFGIDVILIQPGAYQTDLIGENRQVTRSAGSKGAQYQEMAQNLSKWYDKVVVGRAIDPSHLAQQIVRLLDQQKPLLRYPIGPSTGWRRLVLRILPFGFVERYFQRIINSSKRQ